MTDNDSLIYLAAFRYALGRRTYITSVVSQEISSKMSEMKTADLELIRDEISWAKETKSLGDLCDERNWLLLYSRVCDELDNREQSLGRYNDTD